MSAASNQNKYRNLSKEYAQLTPVVDTFRAWQQTQEDATSAQEMLRDPDPEMKSMAEDELQQARERAETLELDLQKLLLPKDPHDDSNIFLEIRAGTGGDEAAIFAGDLFRMYVRYAELNKWQVEVLSESTGEHGGYREIIARIVGQGAYSRLKFESGAHRVRRARRRLDRYERSPGAPELRHGLRRAHRHELRHRRHRLAAGQRDLDRGGERGRDRRFPDRCAVRRHPDLRGTRRRHRLPDDRRRRATVRLRQPRDPANGRVHAGIPRIPGTVRTDHEEKLPT